MKLLPCLAVAAALAVPALAAVEIQPEAGAAYFVLRDAHLEGSPTPLARDEPARFAPFVAANVAFSERFRLRFAYHYIDNARATVQLGSPPGSPLQVIVWGHYRDDVHLLSAAPEFAWNVAPSLTLAVAPQLNWVVSRGRVSYSTDYPLILLVAPHDRNDEGLTLGGGVRLLWSLGGRTSISAGYHYLDLSPSFDREAHVFSGGLSWKF